MSCWYLIPISNIYGNIFNNQKASLAKYAAFLTQNQLNENISISIKYSFATLLLTTLHTLGQISRLLISYFCDLALLISTLTLWMAAYSFASGIGNSRLHLTWNEVHARYCFVRKLSQVINYAIGPLITIYLGNSLLYQSTSLDDILMLNTVYRELRLIVFLLTSICTFLFAADACGQVCHNYSH